jgi:hypothetical protein
MELKMAESVTLIPKYKAGDGAYVVLLAHRDHACPLCNHVSKSKIYEVSEYQTIEDVTVKKDAVVYGFKWQLRNKDKQDSIPPGIRVNADESLVYPTRTLAEALASKLNAQLDTIHLLKEFNKEKSDPSDREETT